MFIACIYRCVSAFEFCRCRCANRSGQTMIEYVIVTVLFMGMVVVLGLFVYALREHSDRVLDLVASDYP